MQKSILLLSSLVLLLNSSLIGQDNLIKNGQFISGTDGWKILLDEANKPIKAHIEHASSYKDYGLADNFIGTNFVELDEQSAIQQTILTQPKENYNLTFAYAHRPEAGSQQLIVTVGGNTVYTATIKNDVNEGHFIYKTVQFTAVNPETKISFYAVSVLDGVADKGILLTDVLCAPSSEINLIEYSDGKF